MIWGIFKVFKMCSITYASHLSVCCRHRSRHYRGCGGSSLTLSLSLSSLLFVFVQIVVLIVLAFVLLAAEKIDLKTLENWTKLAFCEWTQSWPHGMFSHEWKTSQMSHSAHTNVNGKLIVVISVAWDFCVFQCVLILCRWVKEKMGERKEA